MTEPETINCGTCRFWDVWAAKSGTGCSGQCRNKECPDYRQEFYKTDHTNCVFWEKGEEER